MLRAINGDIYPVKIDKKITILSGINLNTIHFNLDKYVWDDKERKVLYVSDEQSTTDLLKADYKDAVIIDTDVCDGLHYTMMEAYLKGLQTLITNHHKQFIGATQSLEVIEFAYKVFGDEMQYICLAEDKAHYFDIDGLDSAFINEVEIR